MYFRDIVEFVLGISVITLLIIGWKFKIDMLMLFGFLILYTWLTIKFMNVIRETGSVPKKILFTILIFNNFFLMGDSLLRYT
jgi:hypothetical protein